MVPAAATLLTFESNRAPVMTGRSAISPRLHAVNVSPRMAAGAALTVAGVGLAMSLARPGEAA